MTSHFSPHLQTLRLLQAHDEEYICMQYLLRMALRSISVRILSIHALHTQDVLLQFESKFETSIVLDSWVKVNHLPADNSLNHIIQHGGHMHIQDMNKGIAFTMSDVQIKETNGDAHYELLHCRVATGRSFIIGKESLGKQGIPTGYHSLKIDLSERDGISKDRYIHQYILNDERRILPSYVVNFVMNASIDRVIAPDSTPRCENCERRRSSVYCVKENLRLCHACDADIHTKQNSRGHSRIPLKEMPSTLGQTTCRHHRGVPVQFFDADAHVPVCIHCRMTGSHSSGRLATHELLPIEELYSKTMNDMEKDMELVKDRRALIMQQLKSIANRSIAVQKQHDQLYTQINEMVQRLVTLLGEETHRKLSALASDEAELKRQLEYFDWANSFGAHCSRMMDPVDFLQTYRAHSHVMAMTPSEIMEHSTNIRPDVRVVGKLELIVGEFEA